MQRANFFIFFAVIFCSYNRANCIDCGTGKQIHDRVCIPQNYDKTALPNETSTPVKIEFWNLKVTEIDDMAQEITITVDLASTWLEPRLETDFSAAEVANKTRNAVTFGNSDLIWVPDLFIYNLTSFQRMSVLTPLAGFNIYADKRVQVYITAEIIITCEMDFKDFPMESQLCQFSIGSTTYTEDVMPFSTNVFDETNRFHPNQVHRILTHNKEPGHETVHKGVNGDYSLAGFRIQLIRYAAPFFLKYHLPCLGIVTVSHVSFIITPLAIPGRVALLVTLFLVLTTFFANVQANTPKSLEMTAISSYILVCILFLFGIMMVLGYHLFIHRQSATLKQKEVQKEKTKKEKKAAKEAAKGSAKGSKTPTEVWDEVSLDENGEKVEENKKGPCYGVKWVLTALERYAVSIEDKEKYSRRVDRNCFIIFGLTFFIYNLVYTVIYNTRPIAGGPYEEFMPE